MVTIDTRLRLGTREAPRYKHFKLLRGSLLGILLLVTGCGGGRETLLKEIAEFDRSVQTGTEAIAAYYTNINEQEVKLYTMVIELNPGCELGDFINYQCLDTKWDGQSGQFFASPLKQPPIPLASIQARLDILRELSAYSKNLAALAGDSSAEQFQGNIITLTTRLQSLEKKFGDLQKKAEEKQKEAEANKTDDPSIKPDLSISERYLTPLGTIIGILGKMAIQEAQWSAVRQAIIDAEAPINTILTEIGNDLDAYVYPLTVTGANQRYKLLIINYNQRRAQLKPEERSKLLNDILSAKTAYDLAIVTKPSIVPNDLLETHSKLVKLAKSDGNPKDLAEVKAWLDRFKTDVEQLIVAVKQLAQIEGEK
ncbi:MULTISPECIES: hypothetical protein [unclassified Microcystis]|jgi:hypothetical protein|uniref:hypothetical protein n=2 Tax=Microcystis sp. TaxID=1127 RepID=UPI0022C5E4F1|nr:hypothetical protein [Microcystis sp. LE17-20D]MCZ8067633.1 hypothetical protein [Microcystis sp. LE17-20D]MCZ8159148.1 hypothetical protein [Microcystis sp. LE19-196.1B]MCZ8276616.1 hypothetical protein [Microcystis sp. LE19-4.1E]